MELVVGACAYMDALGPGVAHSVGCLVIYPIVTRATPRWWNGIHTRLKSAGLTRQLGVQVSPWVLMEKTINIRGLIKEGKVDQAKAMLEGKKVTPLQALNILHKAGLIRYK